MLRVRDSNKGQTLFGQVQRGELDIELNLSKKSDEWNLAAYQCIYVELI